MIIGITGGIASGKTTVSNILKKRGAFIIDADQIAHEILKKGKPGWKEVKEEFGKKILTQNGEIDRSYLGELVFNDQNKLKKLENITHPLIIAEIKKRIKNAKSRNHAGKPIFLDAALLYETGLDKLVDEVWVIYVDRETQLNRLMQRDNFSRIQAQKRIDSQISLEKKKVMADRVIANRGSFMQLKEKINIIWKEI